MVAGRDVRAGGRELWGDLTRYLRVAQQGAAIIVTSRDVVIAEIGPPSRSLRKPRELGAMRGQIWMEDDFDVWPPGITTG